MSEWQSLSGSSSEICSISLGRLARCGAKLWQIARLTRGSNSRRYAFTSKPSALVDFEMARDQAAILGIEAALLTR
jgi:hypothetical protein